MKSTTLKRQLLVRIPNPSNHYGWEIFAPDGTAIEGWRLASIGQDQSGRHVLHLTFDQFECIDSEGNHLEIEVTGMPVTPVSKEKPLPSPCHHGIPRH